MSTEPNVKLSDILAARKDLAVLEKTSSASVRRKTQSEVNKVIIGMVSLMFFSYFRMMFLKVLNYYPTKADTRRYFKGN